MCKSNKCIFIVIYVWYIYKKSKIWELWTVFYEKKVMVNNSTNINKTKQILNHAGQQFHHYQQNNHLSPQLIACFYHMSFFNFNLFNIM